MIKISIEDEDGNGVRLNITSHGWHEEPLQVTEIVRKALAEREDYHIESASFLDE